MDKNRNENITNDRIRILRPSSCLECHLESATTAAEAARTQNHISSYLFFNSISFTSEMRFFLLHTISSSAAAARSPSTEEWRRIRTHYEVFRKPEIRWKRRPKQRQQQQNENVLKRTRDWVRSGVKWTTTSLEAQKNRQKRRRQEKRSKNSSCSFLHNVDA